MSTESSATEVRLSRLEEDGKELRETIKQIFDLLRDVREAQIKASAPLPPLQACPLCITQSEELKSLKAEFAEFKKTAASAEEVKALRAEVDVLKEYVAQAKGVGRAFQVLYGILGISGIGAVLKYIFAASAK